MKTTPGLSALALALAAAIGGSAILASCESTSASYSGQKKSSVPRTVKLRQSTHGY